MPRPEAAPGAGAGRTRVLVVEDHDLLAQSLRIALSAEGMQVTIPDLARDSVAETARREQPHVALLDLDLGPSGGDGMSLVAPLVAAHARVLVVTGSSDRDRHARCLEHGATAVLPKTDSLDELLAAVRAAAAGEPVMSAAARYALLAEGRALRHRRADLLAPFNTLTGREKAVFGAVLDGHSAIEIAGRASVSEATVRTQIRAVLAKLGVNSRQRPAGRGRRYRWSFGRRTPVRTRCRIR